MTRYSFDAQTRFVIEDFNQAKPFASFLPGLAGTHGKPMWAFYVNRGQGIASFGIRDKDGAIMEFHPAHRSYQLVPTQGFRTFLKHEEGWYEPFAYTGAGNAKERMIVSPNGLELSSRDERHGFEVTVSYTTLPGESFAGLLRKVAIRNLRPETRAIELLDGMPAILPYGLSNGAYKEIGNTLKAWMDVENAERGVPFYQLRSSTADTAEVSEIEGGHFVLSFRSQGGKDEQLVPIVDKDVVFGQNTSLNVPERFVEYGLGRLKEQPQATTNKVPAGFTPLDAVLAGNESVELYTLIGHVRRVDAIERRLGELVSRAYMEAKRQEAERLVNELTSCVETRTSHRLFDAYCRQNYLDNVLRGGHPVTFGSAERPIVYHLYSRKHGDLERDYNFFSLDPGYYSQGNGNFRDANQNRRNDVFIHPEVGDFNVVMFMSFIQPDGYNPLVIKGCRFYLKDRDAVLALASPEVQESLAGFFRKSYTPGELLEFLEERRIELSVPAERFLETALTNSEQSYEAEFGEGYWIDHWTYNMDLIESYLGVYPDRLETLAFGNRDYLYYDSPAMVLPRGRKYVNAGNKIRQYGAVEESEAKEKLLRERKTMRHWVRLNHGQGELYRTTLYEKLLVLALTKFTSIDPDGVGIEMEANKPGWNDSMNGLPGLFASGFSELCELKRLLGFMGTLKQVGPAKIRLPEEVADLLEQAGGLLERYERSARSEADAFAYWDAVATAREQYRERVEFGFAGTMREMARAEIHRILEAFERKADAGIGKALEIGQGIYPTYFYYEAAEWEPLLEENGEPRLNGNKQPLVRVKRFERRTLPYFLEGPARAMKILTDREAKARLSANLKQSGVYDAKLRMYKVNAPLADQPFEIGRSRAFTPGWLENESVFLHMEYKYLLELLKGGLHEQFFEAARDALIPFLDPEMYGRSTLENSSFIASSANPDASLHGTGFVARLSGSTAEFLSMWNVMMWGKAPFAMEDGELSLRLNPVLPDWLFDERDTVQAKFLGSCDVAYVNPRRKSTFGTDGAAIAELRIRFRDGGEARVEGNAVRGALAERIRNKEAERIEALLN